MAAQVSKRYILNDFRLEPDKRLLCLDKKAVHLTNRPFQVLLYLIEERERVVTRDELLERFWGGKDVYDDTLGKCIGAIRKALNDRSENPRYIETRYAEGYRYIGPIEEQLVQGEVTIDESEKTRGFKPTVEEGYLEILPAGESTPQTPVPDGKMVSTNLPAKKRSSVHSVMKAPQALLSHRALALALVLSAVLLLSVGWLALHKPWNSAEARGNSLPSAASPILSIAVLPLKNLSDDAANEYFSDGLTESLITELSKIDSLRVMSRNSVFTLKGKDVDPREVGRKFDVAAILEGSIRKSGDSVRVEVRLVNTRDGSIIWSGNSFNRALKDTFVVQDEIACSVAAGLRVKLCGELETAKHYTNNVEAYQSYLKGRYYWNKRTSEGIRRSIEYYEHAITIDPNYALAYAGLADSYIQGIWHAAFDAKAVLRKARAAALRAVEIDDSLADAHTALANIYQLDWDWAGAEQEINRALALNPRLARAHHVQAFHLASMGRHEEALAAIKQAQALDPLNMIINSDVAEILSSARRPEEAIEQGLKVVEMDPNFANAHLFLATAYHIHGRAEESVEEYLKAKALNGESATRIAALRKACEEKGLKGVYQKELEELLKKRASGGYYSSLHLAELYTLLEQKEAAFKWLEIAYADHSAEMVIIKAWPVFDPLRSDPRFADLLRRIGLPD